jgi:hypothetical protein
VPVVQLITGSDVPVVHLITGSDVPVVSYMARNYIHTRIYMYD